MTLEFFDLANVPATPWKNGGGSTRELACWPPATAAAGGMDSFGWRVSVATIAAPGPFSAFAGVDRQIMLLGGDGVHLTSSGWQHTLAERWQPFAFSGDEAVDCTMLGGISTDFNLMLRRGVWEGGTAGGAQRAAANGGRVVHGSARAMANRASGAGRARFDGRAGRLVVGRRTATLAAGARSGQRRARAGIRGTGAGGILKI